LLTESAVAGDALRLPVGVDDESRRTVADTPDPFLHCLGHVVAVIAVDRRHGLVTQLLTSKGSAGVYFSDMGRMAWFFIVSPTMDYQAINE